MSSMESKEQAGQPGLLPHIEFTLPHPARWQCGQRGSWAGATRQADWIGTELTQPCCGLRSARSASVPDWQGWQRNAAGVLGLGGEKAQGAAWGCQAQTCSLLTALLTAGTGQGRARLKWLPLPLPPSCACAAKLLHRQHKWHRCPGACQGQQEPQTPWQAQIPAPLTPPLPLISSPSASTILGIPSAHAQVMLSLPALRGLRPGPTGHHEPPGRCCHSPFLQGACCKAAGTPLGTITRQGPCGCCELCPGTSVPISPASPSMPVQVECEPQAGAC